MIFSSAACDVRIPIKRGAGYLDLLSHLLLAFEPRNLLASPGRRILGGVCGELLVVFLVLWCQNVVCFALQQVVVKVILGRRHICKALVLPCLFQEQFSEVVFCQQESNLSEA